MPCAYGRYGRVTSATLGTAGLCVLRLPTASNNDNNLVGRVRRGFRERLLADPSFMVKVGPQTPPPPVGWMADALRPHAGKSVLHVDGFNCALACMVYHVSWSRCQPAPPSSRAPGCTLGGPQP